MKYTDDYIKTKALSWDEIHEDQVYLALFMDLDEEENGLTSEPDEIPIRIVTKEDSELTVYVSYDPEFFYYVANRIGKTTKIHRDDYWGNPFLSAKEYEDFDDSLCPLYREKSGIQTVVGYTVHILKVEDKL